MYIKCEIEFIDDNSTLEVIFKDFDEYEEIEDDYIFFYGLSLEEIEESVKNKEIIEDEWKILKVIATSDNLSDFI